MEHFFLLGAPDPEMGMVEEMIKKVGCKYTFATHNGERCNHHSAYYADAVEVPAGCKLVVIECEPVNYSKFDAIRIDHHRPGDPGFDLGPKHFWEGSSIGQIFKLLNLKPTPEALIMAASDHCLSAAINNECVGVDPTKVYDLRVQCIARDTGLKIVDVLRKIKFYQALVFNTPELMIGDQSVRDWRGVDLGIGYNVDFLSAQVAWSLTGVATLSKQTSPDGQIKVMVNGDVKPDTITEFLSGWASELNLKKLYGSSMRGYAGGFIKFSL